jgi:outer membrane protein assembly factor BamC
MHRIVLALALAAAISGCSWFSPKEGEYKGAASRRAQPLEVPPELSRPQAEDRYAIPDPKSQTTYSQYTQRGNAPAVPGAPDPKQVLPKIEGARLERAGDQRWLVVKGDPAAVFVMARDFWGEQGYPLSKEEPNAGILETDWYEDKSKIPQDVVRRTIGKVVPNLWSTPRRDKFRTRLERGSEYGTTEIFVSNRNVEEIFADANQDRTVWQSRPADREFEAEMLQKMLVKIGTSQALAAQEAAQPKQQVASARPGTAVSAAPESRNAVMQGNQLVVNDSFDRAWRRVGLALDRVGFTVEDRDRTKGLFYVRYIDPEKDASQPRKQQGEQGFFDKLKFWKTDPKKQPQYRIYVADAGASMSQVQVQDETGVADTGNTGKRILNLLYDQLK